MRVLCVAEKPSIAKSISGILSGGQYTTVSIVCGRYASNNNTVQRPSPHKYCKNYEFNYPQTNSHFVVTSVSGHLTSLDFPDQYRKWNSCDPLILFDAQVLTSVKSENKAIEKNLFNEAKNADMLMIWTDCDREGEHIGSEIEAVCKRAKRNIQVKRARFSAIIAQYVLSSLSFIPILSHWLPRQIHNAAQHPGNLDRRLADAVHARQVLDLKIGAVFTRFQTNALKPYIPSLQESGFLSYGMSFLKIHYGNISILFRSMPISYARFRCRSLPWCKELSARIFLVYFSIGHTGMARRRRRDGIQLEERASIWAGRGVGVVWKGVEQSNGSSPKSDQQRDQKIVCSSHSWLWTSSEIVILANHSLWPP